MHGVPNSLQVFTSLKAEEREFCYVPELRPPFLRGALRGLDDDRELVTPKFGSPDSNLAIVEVIIPIQDFPHSTIDVTRLFVLYIRSASRQHQGVDGLI